MVNFLRINNPSRRTIARVNNPLSDRLRSMGESVRAHGSSAWTKAKAKGAEYGAKAKVKGADLARRGATAVGRAAIKGAKVGSKFAAKHAASGLQRTAGALARYSTKPNPSLARRVQNIVDRIPVNAPFRAVESEVRKMASKAGSSAAQTDRLVETARSRFHKRLLKTAI